MTLSALRTLLETATEVDQAEVLKMAFDVFCPKPIIACIPDENWNKWVLFRHRLRLMLLCKAYESAALLIMRGVLPGWRAISDENCCEAIQDDGEGYFCVEG